MITEVMLAGIADQVGLQEPPQRRGVDAGLVIIHAKLWQPSLSGELEPAHIGLTRDQPVRCAPVIIAVDAEQRADQAVSIS